MEEGKSPEAQASQSRRQVKGCVLVRLGSVRKIRAARPRNSARRVAGVAAKFEQRHLVVGVPASAFPTDVERIALAVRFLQRDLHALTGSGWADLREEFERMRWPSGRHREVGGDATSLSEPRRQVSTRRGREQGFAGVKRIMLEPVTIIIQRRQLNHSCALRRESAADAIQHNVRLQASGRLEVAHQPPPAEAEPPFARVRRAPRSAGRLAGSCS